jgi:hypothetical protein
MGLILRTSSLANAGDSISVKGTALEYSEGDGNFMYLLSNMSGSIVKINGDTALTGSLNISTILNATTDTDRFLVSDAGIIKYRSGSQILADIAANLQNVTDTGATTTNIITVGGVTGSLFGTASWASRAVSSSYALTATSASYAQTASYVLNAISASYVLNAVSASYVLNAVSASYVLNAVSASYVLNAVSASYAQTSSYSFTAVSASYVLNAVSASYAPNLYNSNGTLLGNRIVNLSNYSLTFSGSSTIVSGAFYLPNLTSTSLNNIVLVNTASGQLYYTSSNNVIVTTALTSSSPISVSGSTLYSTDPAAGGTTFNKTNGIFFGYQSGFNATNAEGSNFIGSSTGFNALSASNSNFLGSNAGNNASNASFSNFLGYNAGTLATSASNSNFIGTYAGYSATNALNSNFLGNNAGQSAASASYSTLLGFTVGYNAAGGASGIKSNNIIIGTNITLANGAQDSINLGAIIFATGSYSTIAGTPYSGSVMGRVGINKSNPIYNFDVSGSGNYSNNLTLTGSLFISGSSNSAVINNGFVVLTQVSQSLNFANDAAAAAGGVPLGGLYRNGNVIAIRIS